LRGNSETVRGGTVRGEIVLGGRRVAVRRPRVQRVEGGEVELPTYAWMRREDPLTARAVDQMLVGVSTRKYARSLEPLPEGIEEHGTSRSAVSRRFVARTRAELEAWQTRPLQEVDLAALAIDGIEYGEYTLVVAMGVDSTGQKHPLAIREGTTENATLCRALLSDLVERGVPADRATLVLLDGGKGLRAAVRQVFGEYALVQRCRVHKKRNVLEHLPEGKRRHAAMQLDAAWALEDAAKGKERLEKLARDLEENWPSAAGSVREGLEETLTVTRLNLPPTLRRSLCSTNCIESMFSTVRRVSGRVTRMRSGTMALRWVPCGIGEAQRKFRRIMGNADLPRLLAALRRTDLERERKRSAA
jgi:transposase-like protein